MKKSFFKENFKLGDTVVLKKSAFPEAVDRKATVGVIMDDSILSVEERFTQPIPFTQISKKESMKLKVEKLKQEDKEGALGIIRELHVYDPIVLKEDWKQTLLLRKMNEGFEWDEEEIANIEENIDEIQFLEVHIEDDGTTYVQVSGLNFDYLPIYIIDTKKTRSFKRKIADVLEEYYCSVYVDANDTIMKIATIVDEGK